MGAEQSSSRGAATSHDRPKKTDYYDLLDLDPQATDDQIKRAYRKKALELHPDRNLGDVENATQRFAEVQSAYEVLSDPQERAWYDSHRDAILRGDDPADFDAAPEYHDVRIFTAEEIYALIGRFNKSVPLDDSPNSFFTILQDTFDRIAQGEIAAADWDGSTPIQYPPFGSSKDDGKVAKAFYGRWANFATRLSFSWKDKWRLSDAPDRRVRRLMEKENKKFREDALREFNDAVRSLVAFVRKRDPRYVPNTQSEAERQKILRDSAAAQAARSRAANQDKLGESFVVPEWARSRGDDAHVGEFSESEDESEVEVLECVVCNKTFKSEKQYEAHEKSKKHLKAVQQLKRQMEKENVDLLDQKRPTSISPTEPLSYDDPPDEDDSVDMDKASGSTTNAPPTLTPSRSAPEAGVAGDSQETKVTAVESVDGSDGDDNDDNDDNDDYASRDAVEARLNSKYNPLLDVGEDDIGEIGDEVADISLQESVTPTAKKVGKAKAKREKKAARQVATEEEQGSSRCGKCNAAFDSRSRLFKHLKDMPSHAATRQAPAKSGKKKR
ncbi:DnaJ-domain-containing protein [Xylariomycetidae sp. FL2044]|nr:DnaJ-domain-containing protein [Xylariomycetidae sp. FL2044]